MLKVVSIPRTEKKTNDYSIKINGVAVETYAARVSKYPCNHWYAIERNLNNTEIASFISFESDEEVNIEIEVKRKFSEAIIRPLSENIKISRTGKKLLFSLSKVGQYVLNFDGFYKALHIFFNPLKNFCVDVNDKNTIYFGAGIHNVGNIEIKSNQTIYIDEDAVVYGSVIACGAENFRIVGYGILDGSHEKRFFDSSLVPHDVLRDFNVDKKIRSLDQEGSRAIIGSEIYKDRNSFRTYLSDSKQLSDCIHLYKCKNGKINGIILRDSSGFCIIEANCDNIVCDNIKEIGMWRFNTDGIDLFNSRNCTIKNSFFRNFDDCIVLKGIVGWDKQNMENIRVENCVIWNDWGRALEIGAETSADEYKNILFIDCDCIHGANVMLDIQSCDRATVHDVVFENIRAEFSKYCLQPKIWQSEDQRYFKSHGVPYLIVITFSNGTFYSNDKIKGKIYDITYKDIAVYSDEKTVPAILFDESDEEHFIKNVVIDNLTVNCQKIATIKESGIILNGKTEVTVN